MRFPIRRSSRDARRDVIAVIFITAIAPRLIFSPNGTIFQWVGILGIVTVLGNVSAELVTNFARAKGFRSGYNFLPHW